MHCSVCNAREDFLAEVEGGLDFDNKTAAAMQERFVAGAVVVFVGVVYLEQMPS